MASRPLPRPDAPVVVALAASAGGLEAFTAVLSNVPADTGAAFVVLQHLDPRHASHLSELLQRHTTMPVVEIQDGMALLSNRVHVIPPGTALTLRDGALALTARAPGAVPMPFDTFLCAMAEHFVERAVAVVLSGSGSDGARGIQAVREEGGVTLVQAPADAIFDAMPRSAIATGCVDVVLPARLLGAEIARIAATAGPAGSRLLADALEAEGDDGFLFELLSELQRASGVDFAQYRRTTVRRRVHRRMRITGARGWPEYLAHVRETPQELQALAQDILIHVTRFFRDPDVFRTLARRVFPDLLRRHENGAAVRIWVPGCSTGEEAYSLAIAFFEAAEHARSAVPCQIFATDINDRLLETARHAMYDDQIAADVPRDRLTRHFTRSGGQWHVAPTIRERCIFSRHDLMRDPPLSRMDLVSCRNVLLYFERQRDVLESLHFALADGGYLLLGRAEGTRANAERFVTFDADARIFRSSLAMSRRTPRMLSDPREASRWPVPPVLEGMDATTAYEELVAANEEFAAANEELQSLNEELESSKEETEAANQELRTVNEELDRRNAALIVAREFAQATLDAVRGSLVVLDLDRRVLYANRTFYKTFGLAEGTVERRPLHDLGPGYFDSVALRALLERTVAEHQDVDDVEIRASCPGAVPAPC